MNWINVNDQLPETIEQILVKPEDNLSPERTKKLIVLTEMGTVSDNFRLKMLVGEKEWAWFMGYEGDEEITHWMLFEEPSVTIRLDSLNVGDKLKYDLNDVGIFKVIAKDEENWIKTVRTQSGRTTGGFPWTKVYPVNE